MTMAKVGCEQGKPKSDHCEMTTVAILFAGVPVADLDAAIDWYSRLFGHPADIIVSDDELMWRFADEAWLYIVRDAQRAGHALVTLCVANLDEALADIRDRQIASGPIEVVGDSGRKAVITDPEGNSVSFIEVTR
jgi:predicted enzyme related to lactoylglutathione lyase